MTETGRSTGRALRVLTPGAAVFLGFLALTVLLYALPALSRFGDACVGRCVPDTSLYVWCMRWMTYALGHGVDPLFSDLVWAPQGTNLAWVTSLPGPSFVMAPVTALFGPVVSVNLLMVLAPTLAAWAAFLLAREVTGRTWPSIAGAAVFGYSTYMGQHMRSHLNLLLILFVPLAVYLVIRHVRGRIGPVAFVALLTLVLVAQFSVSSEIFATMTLFAAIAVSGAVAFGGGAIRSRLLRTLPLIASAYALTAIVISPFLIKALADAPTGSLRPLEKNSVDLASFVVPRRTMLVGDDAFARATADFPGKPWDDTGYVGVGLLLVVVLYAWEDRRDRSAWLLIGFAVVVAVLALGPVLHVDGEPTVTMPGRAIAGLPLIQHALPERFPAYLFLALAVIAARWIATTEGRTPWLRYGLVSVGLVMLLPGQVVESGGRDLRVPAFFQDGTYRRYLDEGENVLAVPRKLGGDLLWQAEAEMEFRLARTYVGPRHPGGLPGLGPLTPSGERGLPGPAGLRRFLEARRVRAVIVEEPVAGVVRELLDDVLGTRPQSVGGVTVYDVPEDLPAA
jgi:hypothetical protein